MYPRHERRTFRSTIAGLTAAALLIAACGSDEDSVVEEPAPSGDGQAAAAAPTADDAENGESGDNAAECDVEDGALRVYMNPWGPTMSDRFSDDTGVPTEIADLGGGEILARIAAEANNPQWDVVVLDGHGSLQALADDGALLTGWSVDSLDNLDDQGSALLPEGNAWVPISLHAAAVIAYNTDLVDPADVPTTWSDLTDPVYAPIGMADPAVAAPAYPIVSWFFDDLGTDAAEEFFGTLSANGLNKYPKNGPVAQALASGEVAVAMLQEQNTYGLLTDGEPVDFVWPEEGAPGVVRAMAISADTPRPCAAQAFAQWLFTPDTMSYLMAEGEDDGIISPLVEGTDRSSLPRERPTDGLLVFPSAAVAAEREIEIKDWFANELAG